MNHLRRLGSSFAIQIPADDEGFTGRECPNPECEGYFKVVFGTGLKGEAAPCHCPYCGHTAQHDEFWTQEQIQYIRSAALRRVGDAIRKDLKAVEFEHKPRGTFGIGFSMKVKSGRPIPIHRYRERQLETVVVCSDCTLRYSVYGVFGFCPDCRKHNSLQILNKNLDVITKMIQLSGTVEHELSRKIIESALEACVAALDGFGRELCSVYGRSGVSFQNLENTARRLKQICGVNLRKAWSEEDWQEVHRMFQKRHVIAHRMGVVDEEYVSRTGDPGAVVGRKVAVHTHEIQYLVYLLRAGAERMSNQFNQLDGHGRTDGMRICVPREIGTRHQER